MKRVLSPPGLFTLFLLAVLGSALALPAVAAEKKKLTCVEYTTQARFIMGYDHLVHLHNKCEVKATCTVFTNVNPDKQTASLKQDEKKTLLTFRGSPASEFSATVECLPLKN